MWVAIPLLVIPIFLRLVATNWSAYSVGLVLPVMAFFGLCVGFTEELATRGIVVNMLRNGGYGERLVFVLSTAYFALLHSGNILTMEPLVVALTVLYTLVFGAMMYLSMRVTGSITWAILLHAATDPTTFLATGGIDAATGSPRPA